MYRPETAAQDQQPGMSDKHDKAREGLKKDIDRCLTPLAILLRTSFTGKLLRSRH